MEYRRLGKSGLQLSALSLGTWLTFGKEITDAVAEKIMVYAYDNGINFFDSAEIYARGQAEIVIGKILKKVKWPRSSYVVSSKVFFGIKGHDSKPNERGLSRKHVFEACDAALKRMNVEYLDLYFCHRPDKHTPIEETVWAMNDLMRQGKIFYWGTSEWSAAEINEAHAAAERYRLIGPTMEQPQYNMFVRDKMEHEYLTTFKSYGMGTTIWSPLATGVLTGKYNNGIPKNSRLHMEGLDWLRDSSVTADRINKVKQLQKLADELEIKLPQLALAWCLKNQNVSTVILGASKVDQLRDNLKSINALPILTDTVMKNIETVLDNKPKLPAY